MSVYALALKVCFDVEHPLRRVFPAIDEMPDVDAIAKLLWRYTRGDFDLVMAA